MSNSKCLIIAIITSIKTTPSQSQIRVCNILLPVRDDTKTYRYISVSVISLESGEDFWATVYKTVRPMLSVRCPVCLSVTFVHCGQTVGRIKMKLGMQVGLGPGHIVLGGNPAPPPLRGTVHQFSAHICCGQMAAWIKMSLGMELGLDPGDFVLDGDPVAPSPKGGEPPPPNFRPMFIVTKRLDG